MAEFASRGVANGGLTTGIIGTALGVLNSGAFGGFLGGGNPGGVNNNYVTHEAFNMEKEVIALQARNALLEAEKNTDKKTLELFQYFDSWRRGFEAQQNTSWTNQAVTNAQVTANIAVMQNQIGVLNSLTKTYIPITNVTPEPMPEYNSWTSPDSSST